MRDFQALGNTKAVIGVIHLQPLPGTPFHVATPLQKIIDIAVGSAAALQAGGADGCLLQTVDRVYSPKDESDPARTSAMALIASAIVRETGSDFQVGVQMMRNAVQPSLAVAKVVGGSFVRAGIFVGATMTECGLIEARPMDVIEYRRKIDAGNVKIIADVASKQFKWFGEAKTPAEAARSAKLAGADAVSIGVADERQTLEMIAAVREAVPGLPIILAGHTNHANAARLMARANGAFVGECFESGGWGGPIDADKVRAYVQIVRGL